ncbi:putative pterin-4-alpha-carbinolamine dehydratase [Dirofilaria immitis]|nr:putative pterin-4-alpha-carbinolamine dehydratase [Dirofilaria immitis]
MREVEKRMITVTKIPTAQKKTLNAERLKRKLKFMTISAVRCFTSSANIASQTRKAVVMVLNEQQRKKLLQPLLDKGWRMVEDRDAIQKNLQFKNFNETFGFMTQVAMYAEKWIIIQNGSIYIIRLDIEVTLSSHDVNGLSEKDIKLACFIEELSTQ